MILSYLFHFGKFCFCNYYTFFVAERFLVKFFTAIRYTAHKKINERVPAALADADTLTGYITAVRVLSGKIIDNIYSAVVTRDACKRRIFKKSAGLIPSFLRSARFCIKIQIPPKVRIPAVI